MKKRVNILFQSDDNFAFMVGVAMSSLLENASKNVFYDIYYFALNLSDASRARFASLRERHPELILMNAVRGMMPKNNLSRFMLKKLRICVGKEHPYKAQSPIALEI